MQTGITETKILNRNNLCIYKSQLFKTVEKHYRQVKIDNHRISNTVTAHEKDNNRGDGS